MNEEDALTLCPDEKLGEALATINEDDGRGLAAIEALQRGYENDPRLHFLRGSLLAGAQRYEEALAAMKTAVDIAPDYAIARFQYGFLTLTCGDGVGAEKIWQPLSERDAGDPLRLFVDGLGHMIRDEFDEAVDMLERGIAANEENMPLNADMRLIVEEIEKRRRDGDPEGADAPTSSAQSLLRQYAARSTKH